MGFRRALLVSAVIVAATVFVGGAVTSVGRSDWPTRTLIVYKCGDSLCLGQPGAGAHRWLLASGRPWPQWDPAFSPDGGKIAFRGYWGLGDGAYALFVASVSGCSVKRLTRGVAGDPSWAPDGRWIVFDTSGYGDIYKVRADGGGLTELFSGRGVDEGWYPAWSPNGLIAFVRDRRHGSQIWLMRPDGSDKHVLHTDSTAADQSLSWSHNGRWLAFVRSEPASPGTIAVVPADGSDTQLLTGGAPAWNPVWVANDSGVAYLTAPVLGNGNPGVGRLFVVRPDGAGRRLLAGPRTIQFAAGSGRLTARGCT